MEPTAETAEALSMLAEHADADLLEEFRAVSRQVSRLVPPCWGMSLSLLRRGLTFTLIASEERVAQLDGIQYATSGPCVDAIMRGDAISTEDLSDPLSEEQWRDFAEVGAASRVAS